MFQLPADGPLHERVRRAVRDAITQRHILPGDRLPSTRALASDLGVSRATVVLAFDMLTAEGFLETRAGSGTFVARNLSAPRANARTGPVDSAFAVGVTPATQRLTRAVAGLTRHQRAPAGAIDLRHGMPVRNPRLDAAWRSCVKDAAAAATHDAPPTAGALRLREALADMLTRRRGFPVDADRIIVTNGAQQAFSLIAHTLLGAGDAVAFEEPGYPTARIALGASGARIIPVPVDAHGFDPSAAPTDPAVKLAYLTPSHQFPTGRTLPLERRFAMLEWASANGAFLIEDDYDSEYAYVSQSLHPLAALAPEGPVLYVGTLSKVIFPGLRLGYLVAPKALMEPLTAWKWQQDRAGAAFVQDAVAAFIERGGFERGLRANITQIQARRTALEDALSRHLATRAHLIGRTEGLHALVRISGVDAGDTEALITRASARGVLIDNGVHCYMTPPAEAMLLMSSTACPAAQIDEGVARLAAAVADI